MTTIAERVEAGARWLDANRPGWVQRINLDTLDITDPCGCIIGQVYGDYWRGPDELFTVTDVEERVAAWCADEPARDLGFNGEGQYDELEGAWRELILARRAEVGA